MVAEHGRVDAVRQVSQLVDCELEFGADRLELSCQVPIQGALLGEPKLDHDRRQALLCAVMEVSLELPTCLVTRPDDPCASVNKLATRFPQRDVEFGVLAREPHHHCRGVERQRGNVVVDEPLMRDLAVRPRAKFPIHWSHLSYKWN